MGNHGPAYFKRYPDAFKQFTPACEDPDLPRCSNESIVNAYDNAIRYTDHVVASLVRTLREHEAHDSALLYVSDHGESLGEKGLFLHGVPFKIAPDVQTKVPMVMWFSPGYRSSFALDEACVGQVAATPLSHDHIFHSLARAARRQNVGLRPGDGFLGQMPPALSRPAQSAVSATARRPRSRRR